MMLCPTRPPTPAALPPARAGLAGDAAPPSRYTPPRVCTGGEIVRALGGGTALHWRMNRAVDHRRVRALADAPEVESILEDQHIGLLDRPKK